jgi:glutamate-1-semialdehyde aminotransferase
VYSGNAAVLAAASAVLNHIIAGGQPLYDRLDDNAARLVRGVDEILRCRGLPHVVQRVGPMLAIYLTREDGVVIQNYRDARRCCDFEGFIRLQARLLDCGVYIHPNGHFIWP